MEGANVNFDKGYIYMERSAPVHVLLGLGILQVIQSGRQRSAGKVDHSLAKCRPRTFKSIYHRPPSRCSREVVVEANPAISAKSWLSISAVALGLLNKVLSEQGQRDDDTMRPHVFSQVR